VFYKGSTDKLSHCLVLPEYQNSYFKCLIYKRVLFHNTKQEIILFGMWFYFSRYLATWHFSDDCTEKDDHMSTAGL